MPAPIIGPSSVTTGTGATRRTYRRRLADELGELAVLTVSSTADTAVTPDAARQVLVTALGSDGVPFDRFDGAYVYAADGAQAGEVRRVLDGTFDGPLGSLLLDRPFSSALASGTEIELTRPLPGARHLTLKGLNDLVDEALERIWIEVRLSLTGNGTYSYSLAAYPWLQMMSQTAGIYDTKWLPAPTVATLSPFGYRFVSNGITRTLVTDQIYASDETFELAAIVRADRYVYNGTTWGYVTTPGLQSDTYQAAAPESWVLAFGMVKALQTWSKAVMADRAMDRQEKAFTLADIMDRRRQWARAATRIKFQEFPKPLQEPSTPMIAFETAPAWI